MTTINPEVESLQGVGYIDSVPVNTPSPEELARVPTAAQIAQMANELFPELSYDYTDAGALYPQAEAVAESTKGLFGYEPVSYAPAVVSQEEAKERDRRVDVPTSLDGEYTAVGENSNKNTAGRNDSIIVGSRTLRQIRDDFPILNENINGSSLVWLDNGATTQKPQAVIDRLKYFYEHENSNVHRGAHTLAARSTDAYEKARETVRRRLITGILRFLMILMRMW